MTRRMMFGLLGLASALLTGCTGSSEDVRATFCRHLAEDLTGQGPADDWQLAVVAFNRPSYATVAVEHPGGASATCWFAYEEFGEETAETHVDPLSAYETLPYAMTVNGRRVDDRSLLQAINTEQRRQGHAAIDQLRGVAPR